MQFGRPLTKNNSKCTISNVGGLHQMLGLPEYGFAAVARDSTQCLPECNSRNKLGASFETPCGRLLLVVACFCFIALT